MSEAAFYYRNADAPSPNRPNLIGSTVCIVFKNKLLLEHRRDSDRWAVIGGSLQNDESLSECAIREVREETSICLSPDMLTPVRLYDDPSIIISYPDGNIFRSIMAVYRVDLSAKPSLCCSDESIELRFFTPGELQSIKIVETHLPILEDYLNGRTEAEGGGRLL